MTFDQKCHQIFTLCKWKDVIWLCALQSLTAWRWPLRRDSYCQSCSWSTGAESLGHCDICNAKNLSTSKQAPLQLLVKPGGDLKCGVCRLHDENANRQHQRCAGHKNGGKKALIFWQLVCWRRLLQRHDSNPLLSSLSVQCWTLVRVQGDEAALQLCAVYFPPLVISLSSSQNFCKTRLDALTPSEPNFFSTSLACLVCLRLTVSLQEAQTRATVLPRGNVSGKPEGNCFYGSTRWGFVVETSHPLPYGFQLHVVQTIL